MYDIVVGGGVVLDGTGRPGELLDLAVTGDRIVALGRLGEADARRHLDATGLVVAPGFVDPHSHTDFTVHANRDLHSTVRQGVTTEVVGNCGISNAPVSDRSRSEVDARLRNYGYDGAASWRSFGEYLDDVEAGGISHNLAWLAGHSAIRAAVGVRGERATEAEMAAMGRHVEEAMEAGALGISTGLEFREGRLAPTDELLELAMVVGRHDGFYVSHIRNRDSAIIEAITEFLDITRLSGSHGQISHLNVRHDTGAPPRAWEQAVGLMEGARVRGVDVEADMTPFQQGDGDMAGILPPWLLQDGPENAACLLGDPDVRRRVRADSDRYWRFIHKGQWNRVRLLRSPQFGDYDGWTFPAIAAARGRDEWECFFDILEASGPQLENMEMIGDLFTDEDLAAQLSHPLFSCGVDAFSSAVPDDNSAVMPSPLSFSGHVRYLGVYVRERGVLSLEEMVQKMTSRPATRFGLKGRGRIASGYYADLVVFDPATIASKSTFDDPAYYPTGVPWVIVNGKIVVDGGTHTGGRPGRVLRRPA